MRIMHGAFSEKLLGVALGPEFKPQVGKFLQVEKKITKSQRTILIAAL